MILLGYVAFCSVITHSDKKKSIQALFQCGQKVFTDYRAQLLESEAQVEKPAPPPTAPATLSKLCHLSVAQSPYL